MIDYFAPAVTRDYVNHNPERKQPVQLDWTCEICAVRGGWTHYHKEIPDAEYTYKDYYDFRQRGVEHWRSHPR